jgi:two-component system OmpR family sensor kinase
MQLARAEGARLITGTPTDLRPVLRLVAEDIRHAEREARIALSLPESPVLSELDPDAFGILSSNLIENALRHGSPGEDIHVTLSAGGVFSVVNACPVVPPQELARLTGRFERSARSGEGSGLGLAIVHTLAENIGTRLELYSPARGQASGFEAALALPLAG